MKSKRGLSIEKQFTEALLYLKESLNYIYFVIALFVLSGIFGFVFREHLGFIDEFLKQLLMKTHELGTFEMVFFILQNNLLSAVSAMVFGIFLGLFPIFSAITNGTVIGYVLGRSLDVVGISSWWRLLPHGIFELPAIFISFGLGVKLGFSIFVERKKRGKEFLRRFYSSANVLLMILIPLLIIAAIIEGVLIGWLS